ncbi:hypothetical protein JL722_9756 [Aureococcus anophagefferens]|nr:hypothetical protein JL722_9756 [Aureococcus anophagefferens]
MLFGALVPWRFGFLTLHFVLLVSYYFDKIDGIQVTLPPVGALGHNQRLYTQDDIDDKYKERRDRVDLVLWMGYVCCFVEYCGLFSALSLDWPRSTLFNVWTHAIGAVACAWAQLDGWTYVSTEYHFALFNFVPAFLEASICVYAHRAARAQRALPPRAPLSLQEAAIIRLFFLILTLFCLVVGVPTMTAQLAKDRRRRPAKRIPPALSVGFWFGIAFLVLFVLFGLVTLYVHVKYLHGVQFEEPAARDAFGGGRPRGDGEGKDDDAAAPTPAPKKATPKPKPKSKSKFPRFPRTLTMKKKAKAKAPDGGSDSDGGGEPTPERPLLDYEDKRDDGDESSADDRRPKARGSDGDDSRTRGRRRRGSRRRAAPTPTTDDPGQAAQAARGPGPPARRANRRDSDSDSA